MLNPGDHLQPQVGDQVKLWVGPWHTVTSLGNLGREWDQCVTDGWRGQPKYDPMLPHGSGSATHIQDVLAGAIDPSLILQIRRDGHPYKIRWTGDGVAIKEAKRPSPRWSPDPVFSDQFVCQYKRYHLLVRPGKVSQWRWGISPPGFGEQFISSGTARTQAAAQRRAVEKVDLIVTGKVRGWPRAEDATLPELPEARALNSLKLERGMVVDVNFDQGPVRVVDAGLVDGFITVKGTSGDDMVRYTQLMAVKIHGEWHRCRTYVRHGKVWLRLRGVTHKYDQPEAPELPESLVELAPCMVAAMLDSGVDPAVAQHQVPHTLDARKWADEFMQTMEVPDLEIDWDLMLTWFANSIMAGYDATHS